MDDGITCTHEETVVIVTVVIVTVPVFVHNVLFGWLDLFNAELSPKRQWRELRSQEVGEEGKSTPKAALSPHRMTVHSDG